MNFQNIFIELSTDFSNPNTKIEDAKTIILTSSIKQIKRQRLEFEHPKNLVHYPVDGSGTYTIAIAGGDASQVIHNLLDERHLHMLWIGNADELVVMFRVEMDR